MSDSSEGATDMGFLPHPPGGFLHASNNDYSSSGTLTSGYGLGDVLAA
jgi:hypothetical protein